MRSASEVPDDRVTLNVFEVGEDRPGVAKRRARRLPLNSPKPIPFENENFVGRVLVLHRPATRALEKADYPYKSHFQGKSRNWELRLQGRFKVRPRGKLYLGVQLDEFNYVPPPAKAAQALAGIALKLLRLAIPGVQDTMFHWGDRGAKAAGERATPTTVLATLTATLECADQLIVTPRGAAPPALESDLTAAGVRRNNVRRSAWAQEAQRVTALMAEGRDEFTVCLWGPSRFADLLAWRYESLLPLGATVPMATFMEDWPQHCVLYAHGGAGAGEGEGGAPVHREGDKQYFANVMLWSSRLEIAPQLRELYHFPDEGAADGAPPPKRGLEGLMRGMLSR